MEIVHMSIKLVLRCLKRFVLFFSYILSTLSCWMYTPTPVLLKHNYMYSILPETATIWHFCQNNLYSCFSIIILPNCININFFVTVLIASQKALYHVDCFVFIYISNISSIPCKNMCKNVLKYHMHCVNYYTVCLQFILIWNV